MTRCKIAFALLLAFLFAVPAVQGAEVVTDTTYVSIKIFFPRGKVVFDRQFESNTENILMFRDALNAIDRDPSKRVSHVRISASASPEGPSKLNQKLSIERCNVGKSYLMDNFHLPDSLFEFNIIGEDWCGLLELAREDKNLPDREATIRMIEEVISGRMSERKLRSYECWKYMDEHLFPKLRNYSITVTAVVETVVEDTIIPTLFPPMNLAITLDAMKSRTSLDIPKYDGKLYRAVAIKSNMLLDAGLILNLGAEYYFKFHYSVEFIISFTPYSISEKFFTRNLFFMPEFRYWFKELRQGPFVGVHAHAGWYNMAFGGDTRYQSKDGNRPMFGAGISGGYSWLVGRTGKWNIEVVAGVGYANFKYDKFYNIHNGALYGSGEKDYWGLTRLGVNISYQIFGQKREK